MTIQVIQQTVSFVIRFLIYFVFQSLSEGPTPEMLNFTFYIGSTQTFLYFDFYLNTFYTLNKLINIYI